MLSNIHHERKANPKSSEGSPHRAGQHGPLTRRGDSSSIPGVVVEGEGGMGAATVRRAWRVFEKLETGTGSGNSTPVLAPRESHHPK